VPRLRAGPGLPGAYPSDLTGAQWQLLAAYLPAERPGRRGRPRVWPRRRIIEAILYLDRTGCAWRYLPADFPPWQSVYSYFAAWRDDGTLARLHAQLRIQVRLAAGRRPQPSAAVIDSQSVRAADTVPKASRGWDAAKRWVIRWERKPGAGTDPEEPMREAVASGGPAAGRQLQTRLPSWE
jgi:transposase